MGRCQGHVATLEEDTTALGRVRARQRSQGVVLPASFAPSSNDFAFLDVKGGPVQGRDRAVAVGVIVKPRNHGFDTRTPFGIRRTDVCPRVIQRLRYEQLFVEERNTVAEVLTPMRRQILEFIVACQRERNFPPTIREIGDHVGLKSPATVANHISVLRDAGYISKNPQQPRTLSVRLDVDAASVDHRVRTLPFVGDVAAGTGVLAEEQTHELMAIPSQFAGRGESFVLRVRGDSMIDAGILSGDFVVVSRQSSAENGEIVVAGLPSGEATVKRFFAQGSRVILKPENSAMEPMEFDADDVVLFGRVVAVLRSY